MQTLLIYVFALVLVGGLLFLAASFAFGRDEEMAPALPGGTPVELPDDRPATGADLRALRLAVVLRGYRMEEVDWVLDRLAEQADARDREIARLRSVLHVEPMQAAPPDGPGRPAGGTARSDHGSWRPGGPGDRPEAPAAEDQAPAAAAAGLAADDERLTAPDQPVPMRAPGDGDGAGPVPVRDRLAGPGRNPVRGLRPDGAPDRDQR